MEKKVVRRRKKSKLRLILILIPVLIFFMVCALMIGLFYYRTLENRIKSPMRNYFTSNDVNLVIDDEIIIDFVALPMYIDDTVYIPFNIVKEYIDDYLYWDETMNKIIYTNLDNDTIITFNEGEDYYYTKGERVDINSPIIYNNNYPFISEKVLYELYEGIEILYEDGIINLHTYEQKTAVISGKYLNYLRYSKNEDSDFALKLEDKEEVYIYEVIDDYAKVKTKIGVVGYVDINKLENIPVDLGLDEVEVIDTIIERREEPIVLLWDQVTTKQANSNSNRRVTHEGLNVLSPTWFYFDENRLDGTVVSIADKGYVDFAHQNDYEVWALITDIPTGHVQNVGNIVSQVLTNTDQRLYAVEQIMKLIKEYNLDGINLDFEHISANDIDDYIQFVRELYMEMRKDGYILSIDTYVPSPWSMYYNRKALAESSDYIIVMTYDEHTNPNEAIGPVASINFVDKGVSDTLLEVPKEKLIMGIPFYTRIWRTEYTDDGVKKSLSNFGMVRAVDFFEGNNAVIRWDEETGYYYSEFTTEENGNQVYYQGWLETVETIEKKMEVYNKYDLEGVAMWKRGLEDSEVWKVISENK